MCALTEFLTLNLNPVDSILWSTGTQQLSLLPHSTIVCVESYVCQLISEKIWTNMDCFLFSHDCIVELPIIYLFQNLKRNNKWMI